MDLDPITRIMFALLLVIGILIVYVYAKRAMQQTEEFETTAVLKAVRELQPLGNSFTIANSAETSLGYRLRDNQLESYLANLCADGHIIRTRLPRRYSAVPTYEINEEYIDG